MAISETELYLIQSEKFGIPEKLVWLFMITPVTVIVNNNLYWAIKHNFHHLSLPMSHVDQSHVDSKPITNHSANFLNYVPNWILRMFWHSVSNRTEWWNPILQTPTSYNHALLAPSFWKCKGVDTQCAARLHYCWVARRIIFQLQRLDLKHAYTAVTKTFGCVFSSATANHKLTSAARRMKNKRKKD
jgi:hypothetical protein